jgi:hypothetical protein
MMMMDNGGGGGGSNLGQSNWKKVMNILTMEIGEKKVKNVA